MAAQGRDPNVAATRTGPDIRRIVTGHDEHGKSVVWIDGPATNCKFPAKGRSSTLMWVTDETPADFTINEDFGNRILGTPPPSGGTRFCVNEIQPGSEGAMHRTDTIDYVICLSGEITMLLDDSNVTMKAGDIMIQRGTGHAWVNRGKVPARIAFILVDGKPKRAGSVTMGKNTR
jgi:mannose-6-phosphate isomerase-like protein (cupin superfamily)